MKCPHLVFNPDDCWECLFIEIGRTDAMKDPERAAKVAEYNRGWDDAMMVSDSVKYRSDTDFRSDLIDAMGATILSEFDTQSVIEAAMRVADYMKEAKRAAKVKR